MSVLRQIQPSAPPEASERIELMLHRLARELEKPGNGVPVADVEGVEGALGQLGQPMIIFDR